MTEPGERWLTMLYLLGRLKVFFQARRQPREQPSDNEIVIKIAINCSLLDLDM